MKKIVFLFVLLLVGYSNITFAQTQEASTGKVSVVYFVKDITAENVLKLYKALGVDYTGKTGVKIHFGEDGNRNFLNPALTKDLMKWVNGTWVETNVLYVGQRRYTKSHIEVAKKHGFTFAPIDILDDEAETEYPADSKLQHYTKIKTGSHFANYDNYIIYSHFKGHGSAGFGGAIKNLAMGFASPGGKMAQHAKAVPAISKPEACIHCSNCIRNCPAGALSYDDDGEIVLDASKCIGCAKCIAECPKRVINPDRAQLDENVFLERLVEYAYTFWSLKPMVFINVLANISSSCDCSARAPLPFTQDIGILASKDIVAIEKASHDLVAKGHKCEDAFLQESGVSGLHQIHYAEELGMGSSTYIIVEIK